jgi:hypothetical protein
MNKPFYAITALRWEGAQIVDVMMGMFDPQRGQWELEPAPTRTTTVIDRLLDGDLVVTLWPGPQHSWLIGAPVQLGVSATGVEQLALALELPQQRLQDLPRF